MSITQMPADLGSSATEDDRHFFFDITDTADFMRKTATLTGIQRVTLTVIKSLANSRGVDKVSFCMKDRRTGAYVSVSTQRFLETEDFESASIRYALGMSDTPDLDNAPTLEKYEGQPAKWTFHFIIRWLRAVMKDDAYFQLRGSSLDEWNRYWRKAKSHRRNDMSKSEPIKKRVVAEVARPGDELLLLGAIWDRNDIHSDFEALSAKGLRITLMIHDLIPLSMPEASPETKRRFLPCLERAVLYSDQFLSNSKSTSNDLEKFLRERAIDKPISVIPLAQQLPIPDAPRVETDLPSRVRTELAEKISPDVLAVATRPFVLSVGTLEVRKNNLGLAQAWAQLSQDTSLELPRLVFAGKRGWNNEPFFDWMEASGNLGGWIQIVEGPTDNELRFLYRECEFTVLVSFVEGWGLPIGESLSYGKTAVVSDNSSMPEVGGDMVEYCDPRSVQSIANACRTLIENGERRLQLQDRIKATRLRTWDDVSQDFVDALKRPQEPPARD